MLHLSLVTPSQKFLTDAAIEDVFVPTASGELNILEGHAPLMAMLDTGVLRYKLKGESAYHNVAISWGYLEVSKDHVTVLAETAESSATIDVPRARASKEKAEKALLSADLEQQDFQKYQLKLQRAVIRLNVAEDASAAAERRGSETVH